MICGQNVMSEYHCNSETHRSDINPLVVRHVSKDGESDGAGQQTRACVHQAGDHRVPGGDRVVSFIFVPLT